MNPTSPPPKDWIPANVCWRDGKPEVLWLHIGRERLTEPFFADTVAARLRKPFGQLFCVRTPIAALAGREPSVAPTGFIFHMSRCGSTLVSQMFARCAHNIVLSEAAPIDIVLRAHHARPDITDDDRIQWLRWMVGGLAQARCGDERQLFVKFDCWHMIHLPLIRRAFPDVPWIFVYRDPAEVLVSQLARRGSFTVPGRFGHEVFGIPLEAALAIPKEEYLARIFATICDAALEHRSAGRGLFVNYRQLPSAVFDVICPHFGIELSDEDRASMSEAVRSHAKNPQIPFAADGAAKQAAASVAVRAAAERWLGESHRQLEAVRLGASPDAA